MQELCEKVPNDRGNFGVKTKPSRVPFKTKPSRFLLPSKATHTGTRQNISATHTPTYPSYPMSDISSTRRMTTRSRNATAHPGLVDASSKRTAGDKSKKEAARQRKKDKAQKREAAVRVLGDVEKRMADDDMVDVTPGRQANRRKTSEFQRTKKFAHLLLTEDTETLSSDDAEGTDDSNTDNIDVSENEPPKKISQPGKVSVRDSVKQYIEQEHGEKAKNDRGRNTKGKGRQESDSDNDTENDQVDVEMVSKRHRLAVPNANERPRKPTNHHHQPSHKSGSKRSFQRMMRISTWSLRRPRTRR